jgi:membrane fusion protein, macrolide-specific efflux system
MELIRSVFRWIQHHRILTLVFVGLFAMVLAGFNFFQYHNDGSLTEPIGRGKIVDAVYGIGTVTANRSFSLKPGVVGTLSDLFVKEGDTVKKGQRLAQVDSMTYHAPFDGIINYLPFKVGENVFPQVPILIVTDLLNRYMVVNMEQQGALRVRAGQKAKLSFDTLRNQNYDGVVQSVYSYSSNFIARIDVSKLPPEILPDMTADVAIVIGEHENALLAPIPALDGEAVWVKRGQGLPTKTPIKIGIVDEKMAEIVSGDVREGDRLLIRRKPGQ